MKINNTATLDSPITNMFTACKYDKSLNNYVLVYSVRENYLIIIYNYNILYRGQCVVL